MIVDQADIVICYCMSRVVWDFDKFTAMPEGETELLQMVSVIQRSRVQQSRQRPGTDCNSWAATATLLLVQPHNWLNTVSHARDG